MVIQSWMAVNQKTFYAITTDTTYEVESVAAIGRHFKIQMIANNNSNNKIFIYSWLLIKDSPD